LGGDIVLNSEDLYFWDKLKVAIDNMEATVLVDYVGGNIGGKILKIMPEKSVMFPCSVLSKYCEGEIDILDLMLKGKEVQGFNVVSYSLSA
jgi:NADPH:quinone reductase-like Zn-dependent oxidoreductase